MLNRKKSAFRVFSLEFKLETSIEIVESEFLKLGYLRSKSTTADQPQSGPVRKQNLIVVIIMRIEMHQWQRTNMLQIATRKRSTSSPDED